MDRARRRCGLKIDWNYCCRDMRDECCTVDSIDIVVTGNRQGARGRINVKRWSDREAKKITGSYIFESQAFPQRAIFVSWSRCVGQKSSKTKSELSRGLDLSLLQLGTRWLTRATFIHTSNQTEVYCVNTQLSPVANSPATRF